MHICYIDESGDSQPIQSDVDNKQPMLIVAGLFVDAQRISRITDEFIGLKRQFYPKLFRNERHALNVLLKEIKGSDLRSDVRRHPPNHHIVEHHFKFIDGVLKICKTHNIKLVARVWVKQYGKALEDRAIYTITAQNIAKRFQHFLIDQESRGMIIADFRDPARNSYVAHSIFTQKHKLGRGGDAYPSIEEAAVFGISDNHACLQIADLICSTILYPIAGRTVCAKFFNNVHTHANYASIVQRYSRRINAMQYHCAEDGHRRWGITVDDPHGRRTSIFPQSQPGRPEPAVVAAPLQASSNDENL
ncbi:DUF3800 domain-containing protein [Pseudomonas amygdali]|uniref:DUF3800 domain-containing protein n=1 Tax=Pseudomonas amygdali TaxID=47877 RepID=UPI0005C7DAD3|nr:DUF3800 domain-containing protein [Pseudomonas amygdali]KIY16887.1 hypothetical protein RD00_18175 [Pseudomonas amygdali pv. tabaci]